MTRPSSAPASKRGRKERSNPIWMNAPSSRQVQEFSGHTKGQRINYIGPRDATSGEGAGGGAGGGAGDGGRRRPNGRKKTPRG